MTIAYKTLDVYQAAIQFLGLSSKLTAHLPKGHADLIDQLKRATLSIPLNIAEGMGKPTPAERARFLAIGRGSVMECGAIMDVLRVQALTSTDLLDQADELLERMVAMLTKLCR